MSASNLRSFARYLTLLQTASQTAFADAPVGYDRTVWDTWQISIDAATAEAPLAAKLMGILGWLAPEACQLTWLTDLATDPYLDATPDDIIEALEQLDRYSLIATNGTTVDTPRSPCCTINGRLLRLRRLPRGLSSLCLRLTWSTRCSIKPVCLTGRPTCGGFSTTARPHDSTVAIPWEPLRCSKLLACSPNNTSVTSTRTRSQHAAILRARTGRRAGSPKPSSCKNRSSRTG